MPDMYELRDEVTGLGEPRRMGSSADGALVAGVVRRFPGPEAEHPALTVLKKLVIACDAEQHIEFDEAMVAARTLLGFKLRRETNGDA